MLISKNMKFTCHKKSVLLVRYTLILQVMAVHFWQSFCSNLENNIGGNIANISHSPVMVQQLANSNNSFSSENDISKKEEEVKKNETEQKKQEKTIQKQKQEKAEKIKEILTDILVDGELGSDKKPEKTEEIIEKKKEIKEKVGTISDEESKKKQAEKLKGAEKQQKIISAVQALSASPGGRIILDQISIIPTSTQNPFYGKRVPDSYGLLNTKKEVVVGTTLPMSGGVSLIGRDISAGIDLIFNKINPKGGIVGNLLRIKTLDSQNDIVIAKENIRALNETTPAYLGLFGSEVVASILDKIKEEKMFVIFPTVGDEAFRQKDLRYILHFRAPMHNEIAALITYSVTKLHRRKIGIFYEESRWGEDGMHQAEKVLETLGLKPHVKASYPENTVEIRKAVRVLAEKSPNVILCISHARPTYNLILQGLKQGLKSCKFLGLGEVVPIQEILKKSRGVNLITSSVVPSPFTSEIPLVKQYRKDMQKFYPNKSMSQFFLEGYLLALIFSECLKRIKPPFTIKDIIAQVESLKNMDFGGLNLDFDPETRTLSTDVWINVGKNRQWPFFKQAKAKNRN